MACSLARLLQAEHAQDYSSSLPERYPHPLRLRNAPHAAPLQLTVTTGNWIVAALATTTITGIMGSFFLTFVLQGLTLGVYESMFLRWASPRTLRLDQTGP